MSGDTPTMRDLLPPAMADWLELYRMHDHPATTAAGGRYRQQPDGRWLDMESGRELRQAQPMTISNVHNFRCLGDRVEVPQSALTVRNPELGWVRLLDVPVTRDYRGRSIVAIPIGLWDAMCDAIGAIGVWSPDLR